MSSTNVQWIPSVLLSASLMFSPGAQAAGTPAVQKPASGASDKPVYYPLGNQTPLRVGEEGYQDSSLSLRGLTGVYLNLDDVLASAKARKVALPENLRAEVTRRLNSAGMRLLTKEEVARTPGQPEMSMYLTFPRHLGPQAENEPAIAYRPDCCLASIWTSFSQGSTTLRDPYSPIRLSTWGEGHNTSDCADLASWFNTVVLRTLDDFIAAKLKASSQPVAAKAAAPSEPATPAVTGNMECNTSLMLYIEMFTVGSANILPSKYFVLDKLAAAMKSCPTYNYLIETHADQRADTGFNEKLTKDRAASIRQYLLGKEVPASRFELQWFGESRPVAPGSTEEDHAANRRVVVTPYKVTAASKP